jgi:cystathionine beta-lyase
MAATDTIMKLLKPGHEVISTNDLYGGTYRIFTKVYQKYDIKFHFTDFNNLDSIKRLISPSTRLIWIETPTNPLLNIIDIEAVSKLAHEHGIQVCVDNTFATPYLQNPLDLGADIVVHSVTKYLGGHSDTVMGAIVTNNTDIFNETKFLQNACGAVPGPQDCFLVLRGIKTLALRMEQHNKNGLAVAQYLEKHPLVDRVYYPGLPSHPGHEIAKKQMRGFGGMVSFSLKDDNIEGAFNVLRKFKLFSLAESLGGVESLVGHPASMTHASIPKSEREKAGLKDTLIRLSVGIEDVEDLIADLEQAIG